MNMLSKLMSVFSPPRISDPDFGSLLFMRIRKRPELSYWEGEWLFPSTGTVVSIAIPGTEADPDPKAREFYLELPARFESIIAK